MAVVKDYYRGNTHIIIRDDAYAHLTPEELERRQKHIRERISQIVTDHLLKQQEDVS